MSLLEKMGDAAVLAGCEEDIKAFDAVIERLQGSKTKNIAVLGEANCGKTELINMIAGKEVRKPTKLSLGEEPLMLTFNSGESKPEYEVTDIKDSQYEEAGLSFYEIPIDMALDSDSGQVRPMLEEMDAVIYILSAVTPMTALDVANIEAFVNKLPLVVFISKTDLLDSEEDYQSTLEYIQNEFSDRFGNTICEFFDNNQGEAADAIVGSLKEISLDELREFHIIRIEQQMKNLVIERLNEQLEELDKEKKRREEEKARGDAEYRKKTLQWESVRVKMLEKEQRVMEEAEQKLSASSISVKKEMKKELKEASNKKEWMERSMKHVVRGEVENVVERLNEDIEDRAKADAAWLVSEVNRQFGVKIQVEDIQLKGTARTEGNPESCKEKPPYQKAIVAAGAGILAGGAVLSSISLIPTCIIAIPASVITLTCIKGSMDDLEKYNKKLIRLVEDYCDKVFNNLSKQIHAGIRKYYGNITECIRKLSVRDEEDVDMGDIDERRDKLSQAIHQLQQAL
ncbi:MAG: hypothetical protein J1F02_03530 [Lachnospiraceae bacterium]|nr:hypothetical protein [Lachnospiraceae bacterium]